MYCCEIAYGWKLHISVHSEDIQKAFQPAAPIISQYCYCFKVLNTAQTERIANDCRLSVGAQITIPLEENGNLVMTLKTIDNMAKK